MHHSFVLSWCGLCSSCLRHHQVSFLDILSCCGAYLGDAFRRETFEHLQAWLEDARAHSSNMSIMLVGNKADLATRGRQVSTEEGAEFAKSNQLLFMETSAKTGAGVEQAFTQPALDVFEKIKKGVVDYRNEASGVKFNAGAPEGSEESKKTGCCG